MNDSRLETLLEKFQEDQLSTDESRELIEWFDEDDSRVSAFAEELRIVARNSAARMGGDTIVPLTVIEEGQQTFVVYKCVNPDG